MISLRNRYALPPLRQSAHPRSLIFILNPPLLESRACTLNREIQAGKNSRNRRKQAGFSAAGAQWRRETACTCQIRVKNNKRKRKKTHHPAGGFGEWQADCAASFSRVIGVVDRLIAHRSTRYAIKRIPPCHSIFVNLRDPIARARAISRGKSSLEELFPEIFLV